MWRSGSKCTQKHTNKCEREKLLFTTYDYLVPTTIKQNKKTEAKNYRKKKGAIKLFSMIIKKRKKKCKQTKKREFKILRLLLFSTSIY